jgi:DNA-binding NarL/FixJ family response regulator
MAASLPLASVREQSSTVRSENISVLVADDTPMGCQLLKNAFARSRFRIDVVACAISRSEILRCMAAHSIDVAVVSESLEDGPCVGFQVLSELRTAFPGTRMIALLKSVPQDLVIAAFRAGAKGVFCKAEPIEALCKCVRAVHAGQIWANSSQLNLLVNALVNATPLRLANAKGQYLLAQREGQVAHFVAEGLTNRDIATKLGLSEHTVTNYLFRIYQKLGISTRVELVLYVLRHARLRE